MIRPHIGLIRIVALRTVPKGYLLYASDAAVLMHPDDLTEANEMLGPGKPWEGMSEMDAHRLRIWTI